MTTEDKRDLAADLAICEAATAGPWTHSRLAAGYVMTNDDLCETVASVVEYNEDGSVYKELGGENWRSNRTFIAEAREGWPIAIRRAIAAEKAAQEFADIINAKQAEVERLEAFIQHESELAISDIERMEAAEKKNAILIEAIHGLLNAIERGALVKQEISADLDYDIRRAKEVVADATQENNGR
jgi:hypothetical protein